MTDLRKMATIRIIDNLLPIEGADAIEVAVIGGWKVVVKKGEYSVGSTVVYCEVDSWIPNTIAPFLTKAGHEPKEYNGVKGERLRTVKLRGQISQGLVLPITSVYELPNDTVVDIIGNDVSEVLGIQKWEPSPEFFAANTKGTFPSFIRKTDQERIQNLGREFGRKLAEQTEYEISEKLDGSSMTVFVLDGEIGVCSRNLELKEDDSNTFWATAKKYNLPEKLNSYPDNIAIQGELIGPGIQGNKYNLTEHKFYVYDIYNIDTQEYFVPSLAALIAKNYLYLEYVPVIATFTTIDENQSIDDILKMAEGKSLLNPNTEREGLVFKDEHSEFSFKAISNKWLLKNE